MKELTKVKLGILAGFLVFIPLFVWWLVTPTSPDMQPTSFVLVVVVGGVGGAIGAGYAVIELCNLLIRAHKSDIQNEELCLEQLKQDYEEMMQKEESK